MRCLEDIPGEDVVDNSTFMLLIVSGVVVSQDERVEEGPEQPGAVAAKKIESSCRACLLGLVVGGQGLGPVCKLGVFQVLTEVLVELVPAEPRCSTPVPADDLAQLSVPPLVIHCIVTAVCSVLSLLQERPKEL